MRRNLGTLLIGLGAFLLAFAPLLKYYVAPAVVAVPKDFWQVTTLRDDTAGYFDTALDKTYSGVPVAMVSTVRGDPRAAAQSSVAVWDIFTVIKRQGADNAIALLNMRYVVDRRTGGLTNCCGASVNGSTSVKQSGLGVIWPVAAVQRKTYRYFDPSTQQTWPMAYQGTEQVGGITTYRFQQDIPETLVAAIDPINGQYLGLNKQKNVPIPVGKYFSASHTVWVDPRTGIPVAERNRMHAVARGQNGVGQVVLADMDLRTTVDSQKQLVALSDRYASKFSAVQGWGPVVLLLGGLMLLIFGAVAQFGPPSNLFRPRKPKVEQVPDRDLTEDGNATQVLPGFRPGTRRKPRPN